MWSQNVTKKLRRCEKNLGIKIASLATPWLRSWLSAVCYFTGCSVRTIGLLDGGGRYDNTVIGDRFVPTTSAYTRKLSRLFESQKGQQSGGNSTVSIFTVHTSDEQHGMEENKCIRTSKNHLLKPLTNIGLPCIQVIRMVVCKTRFVQSSLRFFTYGLGVIIRW